MITGSNRLTLRAAAGFAVGDHVIVAAGGETGAGMRGTAGVGGTWPAKSYATVAAMNADTSQSANTFAWVTATGDVYQWLSPSWVPNSSVPQTYYTDKAIPKALIAQITAIDGGGTNLTLNATASVATMSASVYYDNQFVFNSVLGFSSPVTGNEKTIYIPAGSFAVGDQIQFLGKTNWTLAGASKDTTTVFSPAGAPSVMFLIEECTAPLVRDMALLGNAHQNKFGLQWGPISMQIGETFISQGATFPSGFLFHQCNGCTAQDLKITDVFQNAVAGSFTDNMTVARCAVTMTEPLRQYVQWFFECADTTVGGTFTDCSVNSAFLVPGFEAFRSKNVHYIRPVGTNATMSMNDAGLFLIQDAKLTFTTGCQFDEDSFSQFNPIVNINNNIGSDFVGLGGTINNIVMLQQGFINAGGSTLGGVNVNAQNANITVNGTSYTAPSPQSAGVNSTGPGTRLSNFTCVGDPWPGQANISITGGGGSTMTNCTAPVIVGP